MLHHQWNCLHRKNDKLMKIYHLRDIQELFPEYVFENFDHAE